MHAEFPAERPLFTLWAVASLVYAGTHAGVALVAGALARAVVTDAPPGSELASHLFAASPVYLANLGLGLATVKAVAGYFLASAERRISGKIAQRTQLRALDMLLTSGSATSVPEFLARVTSRSRELEDGIRLGVLSGVRAICQLVPLCAAMIVVSPSLSVTALLALLFFGVFAATAHRRWRAENRAAQRHAEELHEGVHELVSRVDLWRTYGAGPSIRSLVEAVGTRARSAAARVAAGRAALSGGNEVLAAAALVLTVTFADGNESAGLLAFAAVFFMAYRPLRDLGDARTWMDHGGEALLAFDGLARAESPKPLTRPEATWSGAPHGMVLDRFGAAARGPLVSATLEPGSLVLLRGRTGSGKTTLLRALLGLDAARGAVRYGGRDVTTSPVGPRFRPFAWVPQDAPLITATLLENVALAARSGDDVRAATTSVGLDALDRDLGQVSLGPGGRGVSGGQQRLIALARALATGQPVLLLDEPTEGLDAAAQARVVEALGSLKGSRTILVATHRTDLDDLADSRIDLEAEASIAAE